jgi:TonB family protein
MRKIGFAVSIALHICLIVWLFNTSLHIANLEVKERTIKITPVTPAELVFYDTRKQVKPKTQLVFSDTPKDATQLPPVANIRQPRGKGLQAGRKRPSLIAPNFSFGGRKKLKDLQYMPDFLLVGGSKPLIPNPFAKSIPEEQPNLSHYIPSVADLYSDTEISQILAVGPSGLNSNDLNANQNRDLYKGKQGRIDFNVRGLDIRPWATKVVNQIQQHWYLPANLTAVSNISLRVGIKITVEKSGSLSSAEINEPSRLKEYDQAVLSALNSCAPFPKLPEEFPDKNLIAFLHFNVSDHE